MPGLTLINSQAELNAHLLDSLFFELNPKNNGSSNATVLYEEANTHKPKGIRFEMHESMKSTYLPVLQAITEHMPGLTIRDWDTGKIYLPRFSLEGECISSKSLTSALLKEIDKMHGLPMPRAESNLRSPRQT